jgi:hypothetical protein
MSDIAALVVEAERLEGLGELAGAAALYRRAVQAVPAHVLAWGNLGYVLLRQEDLAGAVAAFRAAVALNPYFATGYAGLGVALTRAADAEAAIAALRRARALQPDNPVVRYNLAHAELLGGDFENGWRNFEARWETGAQPRPRHFDAAPLWDGRALPATQVLLVHGEQGFGDMLQFSRYVAILGARGVRVVFSVHPLLVGFLSGQLGCVVIGDQDPVPNVDWQIPMMSLPRVMGGIPTEMPYLRADPARVAMWRARLDGLGGVKVGLVWSGEPRPDNVAQNRMDQRRSVRLAQLGPLAALAGVRFVSLQLGPARAQAAAPPAGMVLHDWTADIRDFGDTAALLDALDLTISVDTAVVHLAGALGRPVWLLNRFDTCWRWQLGRDDSPWYPTLRQFRQPAPGDWESVVMAVRQALAAV